VQEQQQEISVALAQTVAEQSNELFSIKNELKFLIVSYV